jgi:hypothetical protein
VIGGGSDGSDLEQLRASFDLIRQQGLALLVFVHQTLLEMIKKLIVVGVVVVR